MFPTYGRWLRRGSSLLVAAITLAASADAEERVPAPQPIFLARRLEVLRMFENGKFTAEDFSAWAQAFWAQFDRNGDGVTRDEIDYTLLEAPRLAKREELQRDDLDHDGTIRPDEIEAAITANKLSWEADPKRQGLPFKIEFPIAAERRIWSRIDGNGDGKIDKAEIDLAAEAAVGRRTAERARADYLQVFAFDPNHDDRVTAEEISPMARLVFAYADADGNGTISIPELHRLHEATSGLL